MKNIKKPKNIHIGFRISEDEEVILIDKSKQANMSQSLFLREMITNTIVIEKDEAYQNRVLFLLSNIANNCNQIAHHSNIKRNIDNQVLTKLDEILNFVKNIETEPNHVD